MFTRSLMFAGLLTLAACGGETLRYPVATPSPDRHVNLGFSLIEIKEVTLPTYASGEEIPQQTKFGSLTSDPAVLWADDPSRAIALELSRHLSAMSNSRVAPEPWPFTAFPEASVDVRFEELVALPNNTLRASGLYFVSAEDEARERSGRFALSTPINGDPTAYKIAQARGRIVADLALLIATKGL